MVDLNSRSMIRPVGNRGPCQYRHDDSDDQQDPGNRRAFLGFGDYLRFLRVAGHLAALGLGRCLWSQHASNCGWHGRSCQVDLWANRLLRPADLGNLAGLLRDSDEFYHFGRLASMVRAMPGNTENHAVLGNGAADGREFTHGSVPPSVKGM